jgi:hypothetical protein
LATLTIGGLMMPGAEARRLQTLIDTGIDPRIAKAEKIAEAESQQAESRKTKVTFSSAWEDYLQELRTGISAKTKRPYSTRYIADHINLSSRGGESKKEAGAQPRLDHWLAYSTYRYRN